MSTTQQNAELRSRLEPIAQKYHIQLVILFGSRGRGQTHQKSDTDIALLSAHQITSDEQAHLEYELRDLFGSDVDVVDLRTVPPLLGSRIQRDAQLLYGDERAFARERVRLIAQYLDFKPYLDRRRKILEREFL